MMENWKNHTVPEWIQNMVQELVKRKQKMVKLHRKCMISFWIFVACSLYMLLDFFFYFMGVSADAFSAVVNYVLSGYSLTLILLLSFAFSCYQYYQADEKRKEDKFKQLRAEVIESARTEWPSYLSHEQIQVIAEQLKRTYQINLFFKG